MVLLYANMLQIFLLLKTPTGVYCLAQQSSCLDRFDCTAKSNESLLTLSMLGKNFSRQRFGKTNSNFSQK